jgi:hypothetical protein
MGLKLEFTLALSADWKPNDASRPESHQRDMTENFNNVELGWKLGHFNFSEILQQMQQLMQLTSESHVSQLLAAHRSVQKEKVMRILAEARLQERVDIQTELDDAFKLLDQRHQTLRERYIELCSRLNMYANFSYLQAPLCLFYFVATT